ncbi:hypothetical protein [Legionella maioricensis]|uniref:Uncharacterized protein n=1 Tax=Legionella maioricensis TaxID=2896528 RepID=A0A9X2D2V0_9GAMM|nr:hypothetical protein [Legionella maioricensis]MCL9685645.1 hypothetical protein [Legionella maioricensis]MCL9689054.1 hypothetical protein [Legionella maioricensis]
MSSSSYPEKIVFFQKEIVKKISLKDQFRLERKAMRSISFDDPEQVYLSEEQQALYAIDICEGNLFFDSELYYLDGEYNFVLTCEEAPRILCDKTLHHSYLANGKKVLACGTLVFKEGALIEMTNNSGHYKPTDEEMLAVIKALYVASGKTLLNYISYCTVKPEIYSVADLESSNDFATAVSLEERVVGNIGDNLSVISKSQEDEEEEEYLELNRVVSSSSDYDEKLVVNGVQVEIHTEENEPSQTSEPREEDKSKEVTKFSERRFGRNMSENLTIKYRKLLEGNSFFQSLPKQAEQVTTSVNLTA